MNRLTSLTVGLAFLANTNAELIQDITATPFSQTGSVTSVTAVVTADLRGDLGIYVQQPKADVVGTPASTRGIVVVDESTTNVLGNSALKEGDRVTIKDASYGNNFGKERSIILNDNSTITVDCNDPQVAVVSQGADSVLFCDDLEVVPVVLPHAVSTFECDVDPVVDPNCAVQGMLTSFEDDMSINLMHRFATYGRLGIHPTKKPFVGTQQGLPGQSAWEYENQVFRSQMFIERAAYPPLWDEEQFPTWLPSGGLQDSITPANVRVITPEMTFPKEAFFGRGVRLLRTRKEGSSWLTYWRYLPTQRGLAHIQTVLSGLDPKRAPSDFDSFGMPANEITQDKQVIRIGGLNVENYFTTLNGARGARGADTETELARQEFKIFKTIAETESAVIALQEMENLEPLNGDDEAIVTFVTRLNSFLDTNGKTSVYDFVDTGVIGGDVIRCAIIYETSLVKPVGDPAVLVYSASEKHRPSVAQTFETIGGSTAERITVVSNHFKSKGPGSCSALCDDGNDADGCGLTATGPNRAGCVQSFTPSAGGSPLPDGQGSWSKLRLEGAQELALWLEGNPTGEQDSETYLDRYMILGDLNMYKKEDGVRHLESAGWTNLADRDLGDHALSYRYNGQYGTLDYAMATNHLAVVCGKAAGGTHQTIEWNTNSPEPDELRYPDINEPYAETVYRSSDHDPIIVSCDLKLRPETMPPSPRSPTSSPIVVVQPTVSPTSSPTKKSDTASDCAYLYIRETGEGDGGARGGSHKWLSIAHTKGRKIDISGCSLNVVVNGKSLAEKSQVYLFPENTMLEPGTGMSICHTDYATKLESDDMVPDCLCDVITTKLSFNGNDALFLESADEVIVDMVGDPDSASNYNKDTVFARKLPAIPSPGTFDPETFESLDYTVWDTTVLGINVTVDATMNIGHPSSCFDYAFVTEEPATDKPTNVGGTEEPTKEPASGASNGTVIGAVFGSIAGVAALVIAVNLGAFATCGGPQIKQPTNTVGNYVQSDKSPDEFYKGAQPMHSSNPKFDV